MSVWLLCFLEGRGVSEFVCVVQEFNTRICRELIIYAYVARAANIRGWLHLPVFATMALCTTERFHYNRAGQRFLGKLG